MTKKKILAFVLSFSLIFACILDAYKQANANPIALAPAAVPYVAAALVAAGLTFPDKDAMAIAVDRAWENLSDNTKAAINSAAATASTAGNKAYAYGQDVWSDLRNHVKSSYIPGVNTVSGTVTSNYDPGSQIPAPSGNSSVIGNYANVNFSITYTKDGFSLYNSAGNLVLGGPRSNASSYNVNVYNVNSVFKVYIDFIRSTGTHVGDTYVGSSSNSSNSVVVSQDINYSITGDSRIGDADLDWPSPDSLNNPWLPDKPYFPNADDWYFDNVAWKWTPIHYNGGNGDGEPPGGFDPKKLLIIGGTAISIGSAIDYLTGKHVVDLDKGDGQIKNGDPPKQPIFTSEPIPNGTRDVTHFPDGTSLQKDSTTISTNNDDGTQTDETTVTKTWLDRNLQPMPNAPDGSPNPSSNTTKTTTGTPTQPIPNPTPGTNPNPDPVLPPTESPENGDPSTHEDDTELDFTPFSKLGTDFTWKFPFSLPWDLLRSFEKLDSGSFSGKFTIDASTALTQNFKFDINLGAMWGDVVGVVRAIELFLFDLGLIMITRRLLGGDV